jgi:hypothetical protein
MSLPSVEQLLANRQNATLSTGPISDEGKRIVARNGITHGLSGSGLLMPEAEAARANACERGLVESQKPTREEERLLIRQIAVASVRAEQARALQVEYRQAQRERAEVAWASDRREEVLALSQQIGREPERTVQRLMATKHGAEWLRFRWGALVSVLEITGEWDDAQRCLAQDLLGLPLELRSGLVPIEHADPDEAKRIRLNLANGQIRSLSDMIQGHLRDLDLADCARACRGVENVKARELTLLRRYERDAQRRFEWAWAELNRLKREARAAIEEESIELPEEIETEPETSPEEAKLRVVETPRATPALNPGGCRGNRHERRAAQARLRRRPEPALDAG